jgi:hypothetical protein
VVELSQKSEKQQIKALSAGSAKVTEEDLLEPVRRLFCGQLIPAVCCVARPQLHMLRHTRENLKS